MNPETLTIIEYRDPRDNKLKDLWFDEPEHYIQRIVDSLKYDDGVTEITIANNPKNYNIKI
jgi:hypothetical protein